MKIQKLLVVIFLLSSKLASAQNSRFSQIGTAPLLLNPALTGRFDGRIRFSGLYSGQTARSQGTGETAKMNYENAAIDVKLGKFRSFGDDQVTTPLAENKSGTKREAKDEISTLKPAFIRYR